MKARSVFHFSTFGQLFGSDEFVDPVAIAPCHHYHGALSAYFTSLYEHSNSGAIMQLIRKLNAWTNFLGQPEYCRRHYCHGLSDL